MTWPSDGAPVANEDSKHLAWVRSLPCACCEAPGPSQPHHHTHFRGAGQRAHDRYAMPLCWRCHRDFHDGAGRFRDLTAAGRLERQNAWLETTIHLRDALEMEGIF